MVGLCVCLLVTFVSSARNGRAARVDAFVMVTRVSPQKCIRWESGSREQNGHFGGWLYGSLKAAKINNGINATAADDGGLRRATATVKTLHDRSMA